MPESASVGVQVPTAETRAKRGGALLDAGTSMRSWIHNDKCYTRGSSPSQVILNGGADGVRRVKKGREEGSFREAIRGCVKGRRPLVGNLPLTTSMIPYMLDLH